MRFVIIADAARIRCGVRAALRAARFPPTHGVPHDGSVAPAAVKRSALIIRAIVTRSPALVRTGIGWVHGAQLVRWCAPCGDWQQPASP